MLKLLLLLSAFAHADTPTETATQTATATATTTATATPTLTPTPPLLAADESQYGQVWALNNIQRNMELDRSPSIGDGICEKLYPYETPAPMWTADPNRGILAIQNRSCYYVLEWNTGPFTLGHGFCIDPMDSVIVSRKRGACRAIWLAAPSPTVEARLWTQPN